jgi:hypothetical protein
MSVSTNLNTPSPAAFPAPVSPVALQGEQGGVISQQAPEPSSLAPRIDPASAGQGVEEQRARSGGNQVASADDESGRRP